MVISCEKKEFSNPLNFQINFETYKEFWYIECDGDNEDRNDVKPCFAAVRVKQWVTQTQVPFYGNGHGHKNGACQGNVRKRMQEIGKKVSVDIRFGFECPAEIKIDSNACVFLA